MTKDCKDCDNKINDTCCHQAIRNSTEIVGVDSAIKHDVTHVVMMQKQREKQAQKHLFDSMNKRIESKHQPLNGVLVEQPKGLANGL